MLLDSNPPKAGKARPKLVQACHCGFAVACAGTGEGMLGWLADVLAAGALPQVGWGWAVALWLVVGGMWPAGQGRPRPDKAWTLGKTAMELAAG